MDNIDKIYNPDHVATVLESGTENFEHWNCLVRENSIMYGSVPKLTQAPTLLYCAENDEMIPPVPYAHAYQALRETGVEIEYNLSWGRSLPRHSVVASRNLPLA